ncbi:hypothetical protein GQ602_001509 [Ophiocordyceps camponoti-floridani]|uniref:Uncharacterized protein n=1 Tax=Ophiocordyceps camponoti-floridani TaxID=2030778 RepID=A0A8H4QE66_9HYPO|nr:hypothetical protein GQ602_001509 [Ophiocordyceps camponoti-floridani]
MAKSLIADFVQAPSWTLINATPGSSLLVRAISVGCFVLGTLVILPLLFLLVGDLLLWTWRHLFGRFSPSERHSPSSSTAASARTTSEHVAWGGKPHQ